MSVTLERSGAINRQRTRGAISRSMTSLPEPSITLEPVGDNRVHLPCDQHHLGGAARFLVGLRDCHPVGGVRFSRMRTSGLVSPHCLREGAFLVARGRLAHEETTGSKVWIDQLVPIWGAGSHMRALATAVEHLRAGAEVD